MASAAPLKDIDEQFLQCCICMEQLKDPKILPCLHRYCRDCLKKTIKKQAKKIECPTCREKHILPDGGIDGLKTDFNTKNIVEFIQLQSSIELEPLRICIHCRKKLKASAYCFKCNDFLCRSCHEFHSSSLMVKDHHPHIFSLSEAEARNLTIQKLSSLKEAPRCHTHPEKLSELCCTTCGNLPICVPCSFGAHRGHGLEEVTSLAKIERKRLIGKVADLMQYKEKIYKIQEEIRKTKEKLGRTVDEEKRKLQEQLDIEEETIKKEICNTDDKLKKQQTELEGKLKKTTSTRKQELEKEMKEAREKYEKVCKEERQEADVEYKKLQQENDREKANLQEGLEFMNNNIEELLASLKTQVQENTEMIKELSDHFDDIVKRFETVTTAASSILAAKHDWTDVQCIPDICTAIDPLIEEAKREMPELETMSDITIRGLSSIRGRRSKVDISEKEESIADIKGISNGWWVNGITRSRDGSIVITGKVSDYKSHITVINMEGEKQQQHVIKSTDQTPWHYCDFLSQFQIATVCAPNEIALFNVRDGTYKKKNIENVIGNWPQGQRVRCVVTDPSNNHTIMGCINSRNIYVFNDQMGYIKTMTLPQTIQYPCDITIHKGNLLVCDYTGRAAFAFTMEGSKCKMLYRFTKQNVGGDDWKPRSVCTDKNGFIYMLWEGRNELQTIVQYSQDGSQILTTRSLNRKYRAERITTFETENGEKLLIPTYNTGKLITYDLIYK